MKRPIVLLLATAFLASPAKALEVTNLDKVEHHVLYESAGSRQVFRIPPGETERMVGVANGRLSLIDSESGKKLRPSKSKVNSDGILSGIIGAGRSSNIPADPQDFFVIWEGGQLGIQGTRRGGRVGN